MRFTSRRPRTLAFLGADLLLSLAAGSAAPRAQNATERVSVDLILVDVEARDEQGRPMRGLKQADFEVRINGVRRALYSADDQCGCDDATPAVPAQVASRTATESPGRIEEPSGGQTAPTAPAAPPVAGALARSEPIQLIFYFDFGLMDRNGRMLAFNEARRWIRETMRDGDQVMIVGSTFARGAVTVAEMTTDRTRLLAALVTMKETRDFVDPHMPFLKSRQMDCRRSFPTCDFGAFGEYEHTRGTLKTLSRFMDTLDSIEGRKHLVLLHEIAPFRPADLYPGARLTATQGPAVEEVGAAAVASHVTIHAATTGDLSLIGELVAEYTGGTYNRGLTDLSRTLDAVRNRCECLYRLGIEPLEKEKGRVGEVTVKIRNRSVANLRVKIRSSSDQWLRQARRVLRNPTGARDLPVHAVILPVSASRQGWTVKIQVALHASALTRLPVSGGSHAEWEAGALLVLDGGKRSWDMLAVSSMNASSAATAPEWFVHEQTLADLPPGIYRLGAFVRDRSVDLFGGASSILTLPDPEAPGVVGPIGLLAERRMLTTGLPLQPAARDAASRGRIQSSGLVPAGDAVQGEEGGPPFEIMTWFCGMAAPPAPAPAVERYLGFEDAIVMTFPVETEWTRAGACLRLTDRVEAGFLDDWPYRYHLRWMGPAGGEPIAIDAALP